MKKLVVITLISLFFSLFIFSCFNIKNTEILDYNNYSLGTKVDAKCKITSPNYRYIKRTTGNYLDNKTSFVYNITLDSQLNLDESKDYYTANQLALALHSVYLASKDIFANPILQQRIQINLSHAHFIVAKDKENFDYLWMEPNTQIHYLAKMLGSQYVCFDTPKGAQFTAIVMPQYFKTRDSYAIIHETMHWVSLTVYGEYDLDHKNSLIWDMKETSMVWPRYSLLKLSQVYFSKLITNIK